MARADTRNDSDGHVEKFIDLHKVWAIVRKNWLVLKSDNARLIPMMMFPIIMILIYGSTSGVATKYLPIAFVDYDHTPASSLVLSDLYATQSVTVQHQFASQEQGKAQLEQGDIKMLVVVPPGFGDAVDQGKPAQLTIMLDQADSTDSAILKGVSQQLLTKLSAQFQAQSTQSMLSSLHSADANLAGALKASQAALSVSSDSIDSSTDTHFQSASTTGKSAIASLSSNALAQENAAGPPIDPNEFLGVGYGNSASSSAGALSSADKQQAALVQAAYYRAVAAQVASISRDTGAIYSNYQATAGTRKADEAALGASNGFVTSARGEVASVSTGLSQIPPVISVNFVEPYGTGRRGLDFLLPAILALVIFQGAAMGLGRAIAGERQNGSLTRVFLTPTSNTTIIVGTQLFYFMVEAVRSALLILVAIILFGVSISGSWLDLFVVLALYSVGATGVGMLLSVAARNQEQYQALGMVVVLPTIFLGGVFFPIQTLPSALQALAYILPMSYAANALTGVMVKGFGLAQVIPSLTYLAAFALATLALTVLLFKRDIA